MNNVSVVSNTAESEDVPPLPRERSVTMFSNSRCTIRPLKRERRPTVPTAMATNPFYEGTSPLYACVPDARDLRSLGDRNDMEIPNQVH